MLKVGTYTKDGKTIYSKLNDVDEVLRTDEFFPGIKKPNYAEIFGTDEKTGAMLARHLIIDLFQLIMDDIVNGFDAFFFPIERQLNFIRVNTRKSKVYDIETKGMENFFLFRVHNAPFFNRNYNSILFFKPNIIWERVIRENAKKQQFYFFGHADV